ncbi:MAG: hypothetical protein OQK98_09795 [Gammaproteobacteria bacterium]|nr:hypothetical protein [Gammaproteobacteria bacterium]
MARPLRLAFAGGLYHVTSRGVRREDIYVGDEDREEWLSFLGRVCYRFNWRWFTNYLERIKKSGF